MSENVAFNFCQAKPPLDFYNDIQRTNQLSKTQYEELLEHLFAFLANIELASELDDILNHFSTSHQVDIKETKNMFKTLLILCKEASKNKLTPGQLYSDLLQLKQEQSRASSLCQAWKRVESPDAVTLHHAPHRLVDMEWKFGVTASSSELHRVGACYVQLKMIVTKGTKTENVLMELTLPQFYNFLHEMEKAKLNLDATIS
uniref:COMM domain-containing protein 7-like n=1 Tax=Ciona intestinalis TaxID=7719 RepID=A0A1W2WC94_CIOIN|nr:COMM domain-containing protein 7-like [Ciona intestinalis]XP_002128739.1 COMM domain-containing protein 7-like [Ciona intestinalis]|eukprot:XP_002128721.1 COMM domain-containing protein 7-like [Ciona intestinalis]